jgi:hypothetical protein
VCSVVLRSFSVQLSISLSSAELSELYRPSERRLSAKLELTFTDRRVSRSQRGGSLTDVITVF